MIDPFKTDLEQGKLILKRFALARAAIVSAVALLCTALHLRSGVAFDISAAYLSAIFFVALVESLIVAVILSAGYTPTVRFSFLVLCADLVLISAIVVLTGGSKSVFAFLYIVAILSASVILSFNWSLHIATICSALFLIVMLLERNSYVMPTAVFRWQEPPMNSGDLWAYTGMKVLAFYLTAFLSGYLARRIGLLQSFQQNILNSFSSGFISVNRDRIVTFLNAAGSTLLQRSRAECMGQHVCSVFPVPEGEPNPLEEAIYEEKECQSREIMVGRGDGSQIPVGITVSPLRNDNKKLMGAIASFIDLTDLKRMEERLRRADRVAAIGEMSASLAHEIRNPIASVRGAVQELAENLRLNGTNGQLIDIAIRESDQLSRIISGFLEFVSTSPCEREEFDVSQLLEEAVQTAKRRFVQDGDIHILAQHPKDLGNICGDRSRMMTAVLNLIQNGVEAMPNGGALRVHAGRDETSPAHVRITIEDEGGGIPCEEMGKVFDLFYTTRLNRIGLGMAIVHRIVSLHGGSVDVESARGKGTKVTLALPRED